MDKNKTLADKIRIHGIICIGVGVFLIGLTIIITIIVTYDGYLLIPQTLVGIICIIAGLLGLKASKEKKQPWDNKYSRFQFINWISWITLEGFSTCVEIVDSAEQGGTSLSVPVILFSSVFYFAGIFVIRKFSQIAKLYIAQLQLLNRILPVGPYLAQNNVPDPANLNQPYAPFSNHPPLMAESVNDPSRNQQSFYPPQYQPFNNHYPHTSNYYKQ